ncbi:hypothetical protein [Myroides odoratus]|uniref:hypothetical protein n=1 Tax=Myroides odoratus TaxID=256 RepID=UPI000765F080|nr:hypothetical protein [Myroides odoratus]
MKDFLGSIFKTTEERLKNPFVGSFIISFIAFNWKPILIVIFSNIPIEDRVSYVSNNYSDVAYLLVLPLLLSLFYVLFLPKIMCWIDENTFESFKKRNEHLYHSKTVDIEGQITIADKEIELEDKRANYKEKSDLNNQIKQLKNEIDIYKADIDDLTNKLNDSTIKNNDLNSLFNAREKEIKVFLDKKLIENDYLQEYLNTPSSTLKEFSENFYDINYMTNNRESKLLLDRFISLNLIRKLRPEELGLDKSEKFTLTDKGWFFARNKFEDELKY